jgi:hypothetical protein
VKMWPTPAAHEARLGYQRRDTGKKGSQKSLTTIVIDEERRKAETFATPQARDYRTGPVGSKSHLHRLKKGYLDATVAMFPTPRAQSAHGSGPSRVGNKADLQTVCGGSLNPDWVEWLMGYPTGWTAVSGWKSRKASPALPRASKTAPRG